MGHTKPHKTNMAATTLRSTKGASKHRRDLINTEISYLRDILPLPESARMRLSQLQVMSLACCYIRKCNYFTRLFGNTTFQPEGSPFEFAQAMTGFLLITTREGKLLYISDNVTEYLGHSMVDMMTQGDCLYDIIDKRDHSTVQGELLQSNYTPSVDEERTFFCRMNVSRSFRRHAGFGDHKVMHVRGHFIQPLLGDHYGSQPVFMATCTPLVTPDVKETSMQHNTLMFQSVHSLDMAYVEIAPNAEYHLGYSDAEMKGKSWYGMLHPEDIHEAKEKHIQLVKSSHEMGCMLTVRLQSANGQWIWANMVMHIRQPFVCDNGDPAIVCNNHVISDSEAPLFKVQSQLYSSHIARSPDFLSNLSEPSQPHTITQVPVEEDLMQFPGQEIEGTLRFSGDFDVIPAMGSLQQQLQQGESSYVHSMTPIQESVVEQGGNSPQQQQMGMQTKVDHKKLLREDILNRLKRKSQSDDCKPAKLQRLSLPENHDNQGSSGFNIQASIIAQPIISYQGMMESGGGGGGYGSVMGPIHMPMFSSQLNIKKEIIPNSPKINQKIATTLADNTYPTGPLTPESVTSGSLDHSATATTPLCIDVNDSAVVPTSMLTPDSSPRSSPIHSNNSLYVSDIDNSNLSFYDIPGQQKMSKQKSSYTDPELHAIDNFFHNSSMQDLMPTALVFPTKQHANPQSRIAEIAAALKESEHQHNILHQPACIPNISMSNTSIPVSVEAMDECLPLTDISSSLAHSMTKVLLDLTRMRGGDITMADITENFMLNEADDSLMSGFDLSVLTDDAASPLAGDIEFQQLEEFSISSPSHGEVDQMSTAVFDSTL